jgi:hypothetical protein
MECVALDVERLHLGIADFDTPLVGGGIERAFDLQVDLGVVVAADAILALRCS